ncbi:MAG: glycogen/starch/alpha-glucan phosphorylase, partial [Leptolyngbyaceae cyanobacterium SL_7_1]|nr:glycogen/starch/alpha-glucan phosphorylase [Leptolyngbyaceae cyanobacterium SL_7_1]
DYFTAKLMIKLINTVAAVVNADSDVDDRLKVVFLPDFTTKLTERIYPAIDLAEHLSTAGTEAADTGNMIAALNGGLIIGTPDGSNIEIRDAIGADNFFEFGRTAEGIDDLRANNYNPSELYYTHPVLKQAIDLLVSGTLSHGDTELFRPLYNLLPFYDQYLLLADYQSYIDTQEQVSQAYRDTEQWTRKSILSTARIGRFSCDRAVREYCQEIWHVKPMAESQQYVQA